QGTLPGAGRPDHAERLADVNLQPVDGQDRPAAVVARHALQPVEQRGLTHGWGLPCKATAAALTASARDISQPASARARANCPLPVSSTMAVVSVRVWPSMLPPTICAAPTSARTRPRPAARATRTPARASRKTARR